MVAHSPHSPHPAIPLLAVTEDDSLSSPIDRRSEVYRHAAFKHVLENPPLERPPLWTLPTILTFLRLVLVVVVLALWYWQHPCAPLLAACTFVAASFTDWLDGYLARRVRQQRLLQCLRGPRRAGRMDSRDGRGEEGYQSDRKGTGGS